MTTNRDSVFAFCSRRYKTVSIDGLGEVRLRSLSERERSACEVGRPEELRARLIAFSVCDSDGNREFGDADIERLLDLDSAISGALIREIELHCMVVGAPEDAIKN